MNSIEALSWRYAPRQFDTAKKLTEDQVAIVVESLRLAPSSFGLQPWHFFIISNPEIRAKLREAGYGQPQITDASHLVVITVPTNLDDSSVDRYVASIAAARPMLPAGSLDGMSAMLKGKLAGLSHDARIEWATRQAYIALGTMVASLANESIDTGPMEGFDPGQFDEILGLKEKSLKTVVIAGVGFRSADDVTASMPKVRLSREEVVTELK